MGGSVYSSVDRATRSIAKGYDHKPAADIFTQSKVGRIHDEMNPKNVKVREARDSENHPFTVPVQLYLDVTGSMGDIPHQLIIDGLPKLISSIIEGGVADIALMFGAIGDHECDRAPLQVGQFESGDAELDMWLERTWIEGCGGGNGGESYPLAWYFGANHVATDAWEKRGEKGFIFTIGDEPFLPHYPISALKQIMGENIAFEKTPTAEELYRMACERNHVFHISVEHGFRSYTDNCWKLLGENLIIVKDKSEVPTAIIHKVLSMAVKRNQVQEVVSQQCPVATQISTDTDDIL